VLRQLGEGAEAVGKEGALIELENQPVTEDGDVIDAEVAGVEQRVMESVRELEVARASGHGHGEAPGRRRGREPATLAKATMMAQQTSRNVTNAMACCSSRSSSSQCGVWKQTPTCLAIAWSTRMSYSMLRCSGLPMTFVHTRELFIW
jgi:hypothetical protein